MKTRFTFYSSKKHWTHFRAVSYVLDLVGISPLLALPKPRVAILSFSFTVCRKNPCYLMQFRFIFLYSLRILNTHDGRTTSS